MFRKPVYNHVCFDLGATIIGFAHVYDQLDDDQREAILKTSSEPVTIRRQMRDRVEVFIPTPASD